MATGMARGAAARGKRIAFGDGRKLIWSHWDKEAFKNNFNIATHIDRRVEWIEYYKGKRGYNSWDASRSRWIWNYEFKAKPGEFFFDVMEREWMGPRPGAVLMEPNVPWHKPISINKDWGLARYQALADKLSERGWFVIQTDYGKSRIVGAHIAPVRSYRTMAALLAGCDLVICPEGGMHHAAAAVGTQAIVIFGGVIPPEVLGYKPHWNLTGHAGEACGSTLPCSHCAKALKQIEVDDVYSLANAELDKKNSATSARAN